MTDQPTLLILKVHLALACLAKKTVKKNSMFPWPCLALHLAVLSIFLSYHKPLAAHDEPRIHSCKRPHLDIFSKTALQNSTKQNSKLHLFFFCQQEQQQTKKETPLTCISNSQSKSNLTWPWLEAIFSLPFFCQNQNQVAAIKTNKKPWFTHFSQTHFTLGHSIFSVKKPNLHLPKKLSKLTKWTKHGLDTKNLTCCHEVAADQPSNQLTHAKILTLSHWTFSFQNGQCCQKEQAAQDNRGYICFLSCETLLGAKNQKISTFPQNITLLLHFKNTSQHTQQNQPASNHSPKNTSWHFCKFSPKTQKTKFCPAKSNFK